MLNPRIRFKRLKAEQERIQKLAQHGGLFSVEQMLGDPPDRYVFRFTCRGIARVTAGEPLWAEQHLVAIVLPETYPTTAPLIEWLTPVFHPNIRADGQVVCIGSWYPAKTLDQLVLMLGDMIQYRNYASHDPLNLKASLWAMEHKDLFPVDRRLLLEPHRLAPMAQPEQSSHADPEIQLV